jgi:hypothetical protein
MTKPSVVRVILKDLIDFFMVYFITVSFTLIIYFLSSNFIRIDFSFYFFEQFIEMFFINRTLVFWFFSIGLGVTCIYFVVCFLLYRNTLGGVLSHIAIISKNSQNPILWYHAIAMALGAYVGVISLMAGPLSAWWLDDEHRGFSEKLSGVTLIKKS